VPVLPGGRVAPWAAPLLRLRHRAASRDARRDGLLLLLWVAVIAQLVMLAGQVLAKRPTPSVARTSPEPPLANVGAIAGAHLFGAPPASAAVGPTSLPLTLTGTIAFDDPKAGLAIIGEKVETARLYAVGSTLPAGASLQEVYADRVVLDRNGTLETLMLPRQFTGGVAPGATPAVASVSAPPEHTVLRAMTAFARGELKGVRVFAGPNRGAFARLGLRNGDTITAINGVPVGAGTQGTQILAELSAGGSAVISVERGGRTQQIKLSSMTAVGGGAGPFFPPAGAAAARP